MRLGVFGGSFDPVHYGHLLLAETCREQAGLDQVWFVPAAEPPHKTARALAAAKHRVTMLELAIGGYPPFQVSNVELERGGVSYTVDTLTAIHRQHPDDELFFLMGGDSLADLNSWRQPQRICELATPVVVRRGGSPPPNLETLGRFVNEQRLRQVLDCQVEMPLIELSSTGIREAVAAGRSVRFQTPRAVEKYIETQHLYQDVAGVVAGHGGPDHG